MNTRYKILICVVLLGISAFLPFMPARAQEATGVRIQPSIIEQRIDPGQVFSSVLRITNLDSATKTFYIVKQNISNISDQGTPIFAGEEEKTGYEMSSWIEVGQDSVTVPGKQTKEIPFSIEVPRDASPGGHFAGIFVSFTPPRPKETGVGVGFQVGTIINLRISGEIFEEAQIREFRTDKTIYSKQDVKFITRVENLGNVLVRPRGPLEVTDFFGKKVATLRVNNEGAGVFPKSIRAFETEWAAQGFMFGRYQVVMSLVYGEDGRKTISSALSFWVLPLKVILPIIGGIVGVILAVIIFTRLYIRKKLRQIGERTAGIGQDRREVVGKESTYQARSAQPFSKLVLITLALLLFTLIFLLVLFLLFA